MKIYYTDHHTDDEGKQWFVINGNTSYPLDQWTEAEAIKDYTSPEHAIEDDIATRQAFGYYD